jgi:hypothetical protein
MSISSFSGIDKCLDGRLVAPDPMDRMDCSLPIRPVFALAEGTTGERGSYRSQEYLCRFDVADGGWGGTLGCDSGFRTKVALNGRGWSKGLPGTGNICTWLSSVSSLGARSYRCDCKSERDTWGDTKSRDSCLRISGLYKSGELISETKDILLFRGGVLKDSLDDDCCIIG